MPALAEGPSASLQTNRRRTARPTVLTLALQFRKMLTIGNAISVPVGEIMAKTKNATPLKSKAQVIRDAIDIHEALRDGLPGAALIHLVAKVPLLRKSHLLEPGIGMSFRTVQRVKVSPKKPLSTEQSGRTWKFAEILAQATGIFGSQAEAEEWLQRPAMGLNRRRPIDLLATPAGVRLVENFLGRIEYGVYT